MVKILELLNKDLIVTKLDVKNKSELFKTLYEKLYNEGLVKESYLNGIESRETKFPTGLELSKYGVAIPHTDPEHVNEAAIVVATLSEPVIFKNMADQSSDVKVNMVFMLAIKEAHMQIEMLSQLSQIIQNESVLEQIINANCSEEVYELIKNA